MDLNSICHQSKCSNTATILARLLSQLMKCYLILAVNLEYPYVQVLHGTMGRSSCCLVFICHLILCKKTWLVDADITSPLPGVGTKGTDEQPTRGFLSIPEGRSPDHCRHFHCKNVWRHNAPRTHAGWIMMAWQENNVRKWSRDPVGKKVLNPVAKRVYGRHVKHSEGMQYNHTPPSCQEAKRAPGLNLREANRCAVGPPESTTRKTT